MSDERSGSDGGRSVLALPAATADGDRERLDRWAERSGPPPWTAITVTYSRTPDEWVRNGPPGDPSGVERVLIRVGDPSRSASSARGAEGAGTGTELGPVGDLTIATVDDATDLDGLYESLRRHLGAGSGERGRRGRTLLTFESVDELIGAVGPEEATDFLEGLADLVARHDCEAYYLLDPTAHDPAVVGALCSAFDAIERVAAGAGEEAAGGGRVATDLGPGPDPDAGADPQPTADAGRVDPGALHDVLRSGRRRRVLYTLLSRPEGMEIRSLADRLAAAGAGEEGGSETTDDVRVSLAHVDLPKLESEGFLERDPDGRVRATDAARTALPYLRLDAAADGVDLDFDLGPDADTDTDAETDTR